MKKKLEHKEVMKEKMKEKSPSPLEKMGKDKVATAGKKR